MQHGSPRSQTIEDEWSQLRCLVDAGSFRPFLGCTEFPDSFDAYGSALKILGPSMAVGVEHSSSQGFVHV